MSKYEPLLEFLNKVMFWEEWGEKVSCNKEERTYMFLYFLKY